MAVSSVGSQQYVHGFDSCSWGLIGDSKLSSGESVSVLLVSYGPAINCQLVPGVPCCQPKTAGTQLGP